MRGSTRLPIQCVRLGNQVEFDGETAMSDGMMLKWIRQLDVGRTNVNDEARTGRLSVVNDVLVEEVIEKFCESTDDLQ
ncbi:hypothetical protein TNCV_3257131 [Trichonephila clavipes]|nr:hypothetical protein TNCV_3257131 [Trichonephila clavipes]